jgi:hypothetical protein
VEGSCEHGYEPSGSIQYGEHFAYTALELDSLLFDAVLAVHFLMTYICRYAACSTYGGKEGCIQDFGRET